MTFQEALPKLKEGLPVCRLGWKARSRVQVLDGRLQLVSNHGVKDWGPYPHDFESKDWEVYTDDTEFYVDQPHSIWTEVIYAD